MTKPIVSQPPPLRVNIVRPQMDSATVVGKIVAKVGIVALNSWVVMLALSTLTQWHPGYWDTAFGYIAAKLVFGSDSSHDLWTFPAKGKS